MSTAAYVRLIGVAIYAVAFVSDTVLIALFGGIVTITSIGMPLWSKRAEAKQRRAEKVEDWKRQDEVAARAAESARLLLDSNTRLETTSVQANEKLDVIHGLTNSVLTASKQSELNALKGQLVMMRDANGSEEARGVIDALHARVEELADEVADRITQQEIAKAIVAKATST